VTSLHALASGSSGNAFLLRSRKTALLFDAGLTLPRLQAALRRDDVAVGQLSAVLLSHEHRDHALSARDLALLHDVPVWSNEAVLRAAGVHDLTQSAILPVGVPTLFGDVEVTTFHVSHDASCPVGFLVKTDCKVIVIATDLGCESEDLCTLIQGGDLVVLEANHDTQLLRQSRYPAHLQRRVSGPTGHLSNVQSASILSRHIRNENASVWLAHLSRENNTPALALRTVQRALRHAGLAHVAIDIALRDKPSMRWDTEPRPVQMSLFD